MHKQPKNQNKVPRFQTEDAERDFWAKHDFTDYVKNYKKTTLGLSELKPTAVPVTVRLPASMIDDLKSLANKRDVPYQSLMKVLLGEKIKEEFAAR